MKDSLQEFSEELRDDERREELVDEWKEGFEDLAQSISEISQEDIDKVKNLLSGGKTDPNDESRTLPENEKHNVECIAFNCDEAVSKCMDDTVCSLNFEC